MRDLEGAGLDFRPPGGESPRLVAERLAACLRDLAATGRDHVLVTHKGVLRASLVLALGWDMLGKPPVRYEPERALIYELGATGDAALRGSVPLVVARMSRSWRCLFWVQSLLGSGHLRRALLLAEAFAARGAEVILVNGGPPGPLAGAPACSSCSCRRSPPRTAISAIWSTRRAGRSTTSCAHERQRTLLEPPRPCSRRSS